MTIKTKKLLSSCFVITIMCTSLLGCSTGNASKSKTGVEKSVVSKNDTEMEEGAVLENDMGGSVIIGNDISMDENMMAAQSLTNEELLEAAKLYQEYLEKINSEIPGIWSGANAQDYNFIVTNGEKNYFVSEKEFTEIDPSQENETLAGVFQILQYAIGMYQSAEYQGLPVMAMHLMKSGDTCTQEEYIQNFITLMHESFHFHTQAQWNGIDTTVTDEQTNMRASAYPLDEKPRILRTMIYDCLYSALYAESQEDMSQALMTGKYWYEKWMKEYPDEYSSITNTDLSEGTAEYFGNEIKRNITSGDLKAATPEEFAADAQSADAESYNLGDLAIQLAKKKNIFEVSDFEKDGKTPLESLFNHVEESIEADFNTTLQSIVSDKIQTVNTQISDYFSEYIEADKKGEMTYLGVESAGLTGIMASGFYNLTEIGKTGWQDSMITNPQIHVEDKPVFEYQDLILIPVLEKELTIQDSEITGISTKGITLNTSVKFEKVQDENGNSIYRLINE